MKYLVTGGAGFIGTNLVKKLVEKNNDVLVFDNYITGYRKNHIKGCRYEYVDLTDDITNCHEKVDVIFHLASLARIQPSIENPKQTLKNNFISTLNVLEYARKNNTPVVYAGSSSKHHGLYGSPYAWSKYSGEELCKLYSKVYGLSTAICRFYNVYGPHHIRKGTYATVLGIFENQFLSKKPLTIVGDGNQRRDFTHVSDIVDGLIKCSKQQFKGRVFELGSGVNYSIKEVANLFKCETVFVPKRPGEYDITLCDYSEAEQYLGYKPTGNLEKYITEWVKNSEN